MSAVLSAVLGVWAALRGGWVDRLIQVFSVLGFAIPGFIIAVFLVRFFALGTHWFKPTGYVPLTTSFSGWVSTVTLPVIALSIGLVAGVAQQVRSSVIDALRQDWVRTLRSRGVSERSVLFKHVLRNAGGPALSVLALSFVGLLGGAVIIEEVFGIPGLGQVCGPGDLRGRRAPGHGPGRGHRGDRHPGQPGHRSPARIPEPEGANIMTEAAVTGVLAPDVTSEMRAARSHLARRFLKNPLGIAALSVLVAHRPGGHLRSAAHLL